MYLNMTVWCLEDAQAGTVQVHTEDTHHVYMVCIYFFKYWPQYRSWSLIHCNVPYM